MGLTSSLHFVTLTTMAQHCTTKYNHCIRLPFAQLNCSSIPQFSDTIEIGSLPLQSLDPSLKEQLYARGQKFISLNGRHHLNYEGFVIQQGNANLQDMLLISDDAHLRNPAPHNPHDQNKLHFQV
jgi:hypothetical protein